MAAVRQSVLPGPPPLLGVTIRRSIVVGRLYLTLGIGYLVLLSVVGSVVGAAAFAGILTLFLPIFAVVGSLGGVMVFTNDRLKGVFEYLLAYGVSPRRLFEDVLAATLVLTTIVVAIALLAGIGALTLRGHAVPTRLMEGLLLYALPMSYASTAFTATVGMYWTSLSSPRQGINSPIGVLPLVGLTPSLVALAAAAALGVAGIGSFFAVLGAAVIAVAVVVLLLLALVRKLLPSERFLSPT